MASRRAELIKRFMRFYPPFFGAGIRPTRKSPLHYVVEMKLHWWNQNYVGTHYGGSLYNMCDPFYMVILIAGLGRDYVVWDKAATIRFKKPGRGKVTVEFELTNEQLDDIRAQVDRAGKLEVPFVSQVTDESGEVVAEVEKLIYIRRKDRA